MIDPLEVMKEKYGLEDVVKLGEDTIVMRFDSFENSKKFLREYVDSCLIPTVGTDDFILGKIAGIQEGNKYCLLIPQHMYPAINEYMWRYADQIGSQDLLFQDVRVK